MVVIESLRQVPATLRNAPVLFVPPLLLMLFIIPQLLTEWINPLLGAVLSMAFSGLMLFVYPFFHGGMIGMANDTAADGTSLSQFVSHGKSHYLSLFGAYLAVFAFFFGLGMVFSMIFFVGLAAFLVAESVIVLAVVGLVLLPIALVYLAVSFAIHFYGHAIVIEDETAIGGLKRSVTVIRENLRAALGYFAITMVGGAIAGGGYVVVLLGIMPPASATNPPLPSIGLLLAGLAGSALILTIFTTAFLVYSVHVYRAFTTDVSPAPA